MRILRAALPTTAGLLISFLATAQASAPLPPANQDMLSWMLRVLLWAVMLVAVLAGIVLTTAAAHRNSFAQPAPSNQPISKPAEAAASAPAHGPAAVAAVVAPVAAATPGLAPRVALALSE